MFFQKVKITFLCFSKEKEFYLNVTVPGVMTYCISSAQSLNRVRLFANPWTVARQTSLSITNSQSLLRLMSIESVMPSNHLSLCRPPSPPAFNLAQHQGLFK